MTITNADLEELCDSGFGPMSLRAGRRAGTFRATIDDEAIDVSIDGPALSFVAVAPSSHPTGANAAQRVQLALDGLSLQRGELARIHADPASGKVTAELYIAADDASLGGVVASANAARLLARAGAAMLDMVTAELAAEVAWAAHAASIDEQMQIPDPPTPRGAGTPAPAAPAPAPAPMPTVAEPTWVHVDAPTPMMDADNTAQQVGLAQPGTWYSLVQEAGAWSLVLDPGSGRESWVAASALRRRT